MEGVVVMIGETTIGTTTDSDGKFSLGGVPSDAALTASMIGMETVEVSVAGRSYIEILMKPDNLLLNEIIVTGYQSQQKVDITGSVASISSEDLMENNPFSTEQASSPVYRS